MIKLLFYLLPIAAGIASEEAPLCRVVALEPVMDDSLGIRWVSSRIWLFSDEETVDVIDTARGQSFQIGAVGKGGCKPQLSPDGHLLAYSVRDSLLVYDIAQRTEALAHIGPFQHTILITGWAPDGEYLLFYTDPPYYSCRHDDYEPVEPEPGFWVLERATGEVLNSGVSAHTQVFGWLDESTLLVNIGGVASLSAQRLFTGEMWPTFIPTREYRQIVVVPGSREVLANSLNHTLVRASIETGEEHVIAGPGEPGTIIQFPRPSPGGGRVAYLYRDNTGERVIVDGNAVTEPLKHLTFQWMSNSSIVVSGPDGPFVVDVDSGRIILRARE